MKIDLPIPLKWWKVKSKSIPNTYHQVRLLSNGIIECTCTAGKFKSICRHINIVKDILKKNEEHRNK